MEFVKQLDSCGVSINSVLVFRILNKKFAIIFKSGFLLVMQFAATLSANKLKQH